MTLWQIQLTTAQQRAAAKLYEEAACMDMPPHLFDSINPEDEQTKNTLLICRTCPVTVECVKVINPASTMYEGIAGGHVWRAGRTWTTAPDRGSRRV